MLEEMKDELNHDVKEFKNLKKQIKSLKKEVKEDEASDFKLLDGENKEDFVEALSNASDFVDSISDYYEALERQQLYCSAHNYNDAGHDGFHAQHLLCAQPYCRLGPHQPHVRYQKMK